jgi:Carboxypeptidase regulatory-like domain/TonB-dependent Receptor Plug Domain
MKAKRPFLILEASMRAPLKLLLATLLCVCAALPLSAQRFTGTIRGAVTDSSGAVVPGAEVTIKDNGTGQTRVVVTNAQGEYVAPELLAGKYTVTVKKANFKEAVSQNVELHVSSTAVADAVLQVGNVSEQVTVEANAVQVDTTSGAVGNVVEGHEVRELPLNGRSFVQLTQLMPGVSPQAAFDSKNKGLMAGVDFSVNGNNTTGNLFLVDGVNDNDVGSNRTILVYPSVDSIQEFKILRNSYGAEYGQAMGAIVNIVTQGGTNQFHGGAYYFGRNDALNATDWFNNYNGIPKDKLRRNDWGYNLGGPILKNKLFFFWSEEWNHELRGRARFANVPTVAEKSGDFSTLRTASDGSSCEPAPTDPVSGNVLTTVPTTSPAGSAILQLFPDPNIPSSQVDPTTCNNWATSLTSPIYWRQESLRMDYTIGGGWSLFGRYTQDHWSQPYPSTLGFWGDDMYPSVESSWAQPGYQATIRLTKVFGNSAVNDFQVSYSANRITATRSGTNPGLNDQINSVFRPDFPLSDKQSGAQIGYPVFWGGLGPGADSDSLWTQAPWHNNEQLYVLKDDFSKVHGNHTFKVGFLVSNNQKNELANGTSEENTQFGGVVSTAGDPGSSSLNGAFDALWAGRLWQATEIQTNPYSQTRWHDFEMYYADNWKLSRRLTLDYGLRWSFLRQPYHALDKIATFEPSAYDPNLGSDPCNGLLIVPGTHYCQDAGFLGGIPGPNRALKENNNHAIAPRLGIAWDVRGDGKTAVRAGVGQFYQRERLNHTLTMASNAPFALQVSNYTRTLDTPVGFTGGTGAPTFGIDPSDILPNTWQWNLTVERELARNTKLEVAYVGNRGLHLVRYTDINAVPANLRLDYALNQNDADRPFGGGNFGGIGYAQWEGGSNYHALQALFRTRIKGLDAQLAYTFSRSLSDTDVTNSGNLAQTTVLEDPTNPRRNYGPSSINRPHTLVGNVVYTMPDFTGHNAFVKGALGGWELATILDFASGTPLTVFANSPQIDNAPGGLTGTAIGQGETRPNRVAGQPCRAPSGSSKLQWLNQAAWTLDNFQLGTFGNASVGDCSGPGLANTDFSIYKNFKLTEKLKLQFRMEFFNVFNKVQFRGNSADVTGIDSNIADTGVACTAVNIGDNTSPCFNRTANTVAWDFATNGHQTFGQVSSDRGPREIQYALKLIF